MDTKALHTIGYGLYALCATQDGKDNACIVNSVMQVTSAPITLVIGVNKNNLTHDMIVATGKLNLCTLAQTAPFEMIRHFGLQSGRNAQKFFGPMPHADNGVLYLDNEITAIMSGDVKEMTDYGTHTLFRVELTDSRVLSNAPSMTYAYYQQNVKPRPQPTDTTKHGWRCTVCGYEYTGDTLPEDIECPLCHHGASDFVRF